MNCPRCGAENQPTAKICRMCATPLESAASSPKQGQQAAPGMRENRQANSPVVPGAGPGEILCSTCKAINDSSWAYCQQCGSQLHKAASPQPAAAVQTPPVKPASTPAPAAARP